MTLDFRKLPRAALNILLRDGLITIDTYADSISTLRMQERSIPASRTVKPVPTPRTVKKPVPTPRTVKPVPTPRIKRQLILDEPIPATVQDRLRTPLQPKRLQSGYSDKDIDDYIQEIYDEIQEPLEEKQEPNLAFFQTPWVIGKFLQGWQMNVPEGHSLEVDPKTFLEGVRPQIHSKLEEELQALHGIKFQLSKISAE